MNRYSTIHISKELSKMKKDIIKILINEKDFSLQEKFLFASYNKSSIYTMDSTVKLRSISICQRFCMQRNSFMINKRKYLQTSRSLASSSVSRKMIILFSFFQHLKWITFAKEFVSHSQWQWMNHQHVQLSCYILSSIISQQVSKLRSSQRSSILSHEIISSR